MKTCPYCRKRIDGRALKCPHCGSAFDGHQIEAGRKEHSRERWGTLGLVILAIVGGLYWLTRPETIDHFAEQAAQEKVASEQDN